MNTRTNLLVRLFPTIVAYAMVFVLIGCTAPTATPDSVTAPAADTSPETIPTSEGTPAPLLAAPTSDCLGAGDASPQLAQHIYGMNVFLFKTDAERVLTLTDVMGASWIRQQIHWRDIEGERGQFVWGTLDRAVEQAREYDLRLFISIVRSPTWATDDGDDGLPDDLEALSTFVSQLATRYRGRISAYEIWNEPNLAHEHGGIPATPAEYLATLRAAYAPIKAADPCALVVSAPLASTINPDPALATDDLPFYEALYQLDDGAFLQLADAVGVHPGAGPFPPDARWPDDAPEQSHSYFRHIERVREIMLRYEDPRQVWITEVGWSIAEAPGPPRRSANANRPRISLIRSGGYASAIPG